MPLDGFQSSCEPNARLIVSRDKRSNKQHRADNKNLHKVTHYRIDGVVVSKGKKCDYLLIDEDKKIAYLIELKGSRITDAVSQFEGTECALGREFRGKYTLYYRIVASKCPTHSIENSTFRKFKIRCGNRLLYGTNKIEEVL